MYAMAEQAYADPFQLVAAAGSFAGLILLARGNRLGFLVAAGASSFWALIYMAHGIHGGAAVEGVYAALAFWAFTIGR